MVDTPTPASARRPLRALIVEDREDDLLLLLRELERSGYALTHRWVDTRAALDDALADDGWDIVISDFSLPTMTAHDVLQMVSMRQPGIPCIVTSSTIAEEVAVDLLKAGARDFVVKERMARLAPAIERELRESRERRRLHAAERTLQETRERMQFVLDAVRIGLWEWNIQSGVVLWSEMHERLHGLAPGTFGGRLDSFVATVHADDRADILRHVDRVRRDAGDSRIEYRTQWSDGSVHWISSLGRTFVDDQRVPCRAVGIAIDVTQQKALEEQFRQAQKMESIGNLAGGIAHDFNNLLTVIAGCCDLAADRAIGNDGVLEPLEGIRTAAVSASALTRQLLTFSRRQIVMPRVLDLNDVIAGFSAILRRLVEENVHIHLNLAAQLPPVRVDGGQVEQVLLNLAANARDAMPDGGTVAIETQVVIVDESGSAVHPNVPPGRYVALSVTDTGSGIPLEVQERLFEPFFTTKPVGRGTGLGLATVYGIVKQSDGYLAVRSVPGAGTTFTIYLPPAPPQRERRTVVEAVQVADLAGSETVLIVEDNAPLRRLTEQILRRYGYTVLSAPNGEDAQQICATHAGPIHVVLLDIVMPGDSGPTIGEWIAQHRPDARIIYMSGYAGDAIARRGALEPGRAFLQKPFATTQLARAVRQVLLSSEPPA